MEKFADVVLPLPLKVLTYRIPFIYQKRISIGSSVLIPLRSEKILLAIVIKLHSQEPIYPTKELLGIIYKTPLFTSKQLTFLSWVSDYYLSYLGEALSIALLKTLDFPNNVVFKSCNHITDILPEGENEQLIINSLQLKPLTYKSIRQLLSKKETDKTLLSLLYQNYIEADTISAIPPPLIHKTTLPPLSTLTKDQKTALLEIKTTFFSKKVVLLHGAIGSGKTELYMHLIKEALLQGNQILFLLPEIGLVTHMIERIRPLLGEYLVIYHSKQSHKERLKTWFQVASEQQLVIIGTRSALFLPFKDLQFIIIDEEHDSAYKQADTPPTYHARDASIVLAKQHQATVLLGSGTPSIETYYNAKSGKYGLVTLYTRFGKAINPKLFFIDLNIEQKRKAIRENFSLILLEALTKNIKKGGQAMIFQNRRGYARYFLCASCGWIPYCLTCSVSLTYHQESNHLLCHYCGYTSQPFLTCTSCGSSQLHNVGFGTEKLEETLQLIFPDQKIGRMDLDSTKRKHAYQFILTEVASGFVDILVGTQMIAKGLDFDNIQLIGVLDIDGLLYFPDFRSNEKCFQLITQLAGRAGRRDNQGSVFIQTRQPEHPLFRYLTDNNYEAMYESELKERNKFLYPPYIKIIKVTLSCISESILKSGAFEIKKELEKKMGNIVLGPQKPLIGKVRNLFLVALLIKISTKNFHKLKIEKENLKKISKQLLSKRPYNKIKILFDVDPL